MARDADAVIKSYAEEYPQYAHLLEDNPAQWLEAIGTKVKKISVAEHIKTVAFAYALWLQTANDTSFKTSVLSSFFEKRQRDNPRTTPLHLIVESVIEYGDDTPEGKKEARRLYNRDVQAILYLQSQGVLPQDVEERGARKGEGLNAWARRKKAAPEDDTGDSKDSPKPDTDETGGAASKSEPASPKAAPRTNEAPSPTITAPTSDTAARKGVASGSRGNFIEWRNGSDQPKAVALPDSAQASELVELVFKLLEDYAVWSAQQSASAVVQATSELVEQLGQGTVLQRGVPEVAESTLTFVKDLGDWLDARPGLASMKREHQKQLESLTATLDTLASTKAAVRKPS
jgi:hypothetical protein